MFYSKKHDAIFVTIFWMSSSRIIGSLARVITFADSGKGKWLQHTDDAIIFKMT